MKKLGITMRDELVERLEEFAEENYMSRSGAISLAVSQFLAGKELTKAIKELADSMSKMADKGMITEEDKAKVESIAQTVALLSGKDVSF